jgi:SAM-dependent methyltransferase
MSYYDKYWRRGETWSPSSGGIVDQEMVLLRPFFNSGVLCLDYGCGDGRRYGAFLQRQGIDYRGFDASAEAVKQARENGLQAELLGPEGRTSLADRSCKVAICFEVFEHLVEPDTALKEIARVLAEDGVLIASVPNAAYWFTRLEFLFTGFLNPGGSPLTARRKPWADPHIRFFSPALLRRFLRENGFKHAEIIPDAFTLAGLPYVYRKPFLRTALQAISRPFGWTSRVAPGLLSSRLFARAFLG